MEADERGVDRSPVGLPERSGGSPTGNGRVPDPEVQPNAHRRQFTVEYKARIVRGAAAARGSGEIGALLRREGLYASHLNTWRKQLERHGVEGLKAKRRGPAPAPRKSAREIELERKTARLEKKLLKAEAIIDFQKKVHELLGIPLKSMEDEGND